MTRFFEVRAGATAGGSIQIPAELIGLVHVVISGAGGGGGGGAGGAGNMHNAGAGGGGGASGQFVYLSFDSSTIEITVENGKKGRSLPYSLGTGGPGGGAGPVGGHGGTGGPGGTSRVLLSTALGGAPGAGGAYGSVGGEAGVCLSAFAGGRGGSVKEIYVPSEPGGDSVSTLLLPALPGKVSAGLASSGGAGGAYMGPGSCGGGGGGAGAPSLKWSEGPKTEGKGGTGQAGMNHDVNTFRNLPGQADFGAGGGGGGGARSVNTPGGAGGSGGDGFIIVWM